MKKIIVAALGLSLCIGMTGCQSMTKSYGGSTTIRLQANEKLEEITKMRESHFFRYEMPSLWTRSYFVSMAGNVCSETIKRYVENQKREIY